MIPSYTTSRLSGLVWGMKNFPGWEVLATLELEAAGITRTRVAVGHGTGDVDGQLATGHFLTVELLDSGLGLFIVRHLNKPESFGSVVVPINNDFGRHHGAG